MLDFMWSIPYDNIQAHWIHQRVLVTLYQHELPKMFRLKSESFTYFFIALWIISILILYFSINWKNIIYCVEIYRVLFKYPKTLLLLIAPSLTIILLAVIVYFVNFQTSRRSRIAHWNPPERDSKPLYRLFWPRLPHIASYILFYPSFPAWILPHKFLPKRRIRDLVNVLSRYS